MLNIAKTSDNRIDLDITGKIDSDMMRSGLDDLIAKSKDVRNGRMLYTLTHFEIPSMAALGIEFTRLPQLFALIGKFDKIAVISDTHWVRTWAEVEGALIPGLKIKAYAMTNKADAEKWLAD